MASYKTVVIESMFRKRFNSVTKILTNPIVTLAEVTDEINSYNLTAEKKVSARNPANFFKDIVRKRRAGNKNWPTAVLRAGYTARGVTEGSACFEFIPIAEGQTEAFPELSFHQPSADTPVYQIESVSLPLASRRLGRKDEPWLIQVITRLRIVESHFSLSSNRNIAQLDLLQMNVKLSGTEIDALFLAHEEIEPGKYEEIIITCEAKVGREDIVEDQIIRQAKAPFKMRQITQTRVIPIAVKCARASTIFVIEFEELQKDSYQDVVSLAVASESLFEIKPPVPGICS